MKKMPFIQRDHKQESEVIDKKINNLLFPDGRKKAPSITHIDKIYEDLNRYLNNTFYEESFNIRIFRFYVDFSTDEERIIREYHIQITFPYQRRIIYYLYVKISLENVCEDESQSKPYKIEFIENDGKSEEKICKIKFYRSYYDIIFDINHYRNLISLYRSLYIEYPTLSMSFFPQYTIDILFGPTASYGIQIDTSSKKKFDIIVFKKIDENGIEESRMDSKSPKDIFKKIIPELFEILKKKDKEIVQLLSSRKNVI